MTRISHKAYEAVVKYDEDAKIFHGEVINLRDVIAFQGKSVSELKRAFTASVDDYLAFCRQRGEEPELPTQNSDATPPRPMT
jgi:predicted HicB family RNase H-like nuclease